MWRDEDPPSTVDDLLRNFRSDEAHLDARSRKRIDDLLQAELDSGAVHVDTVLDRTGDPQLESHADKRGVKRDKRVVLGLTTAAAMLAVIALVGTILMSHGERSQLAAGSKPISSKALVLAANGSAEHRLLSGAQLYRRVLVAHSGPPMDGRAPMIIRTTETWVGVLGSGIQESSAESVLGAKPESGIWLAPKLKVTAGPGELDFGGFSYVQLRALPSDRGQFLRAIEERVHSSSTSSSAVASMIAEVLSLEVTPPSVRAAAIGALFLIGGRSIDQVRAPDGRVGAGIAGHDLNGDRWVVVVRMEDASALAFVTGPAGAVPTEDLGTATSWITYSASAVTKPAG